jgi:hypothetical protein
VQRLATSEREGAAYAWEAVSFGITVTLFGVWSGSAAAAPVDVASEHVAVRAFDRYLRGQIADVPAPRQLENAFVASISAN